MSEHKSVEEEVRELKQTRMQEMLSQCTEGQRDLFNRMYPDGPKEDQIDWAIKQIENTLRKK